MVTLSDLLPEGNGVLPYYMVLVRSHPTNPTSIPMD